MAKAVLDNFEIDEIVFVPCGDPPHKSGNAVWDSEKRFEMTKLLVEDYPKMSVSDIEIKNNGKSYTANTLEKIKAQNPNVKIFFIVGADSLCYMDEWKNPRLIFKNAEIVFVDRLGFSNQETTEYSKFLKDKYGAVIHKVFMKNIDISSSFLRKTLKMGQSIAQYTGNKIYQYILENIDDFKNYN